MGKPQIILGIESSCDETATSVGQMVNNRVQILSNIVASSLEIQAKYGGVVPEQAAREQLKSIIPVVEEALRQAQCKPSKIDAIAVTQGPGLIGSLLVGVETAKTLATVWDKHLIPVNHLVGHFYANWIDSKPPQFPCLGLLVSGGHTDLVFFKDHGKFEYIGGTRDDAAGECFDKCARLLGLSYPGGPAISRLAKDGNPKAFNLPRPMIGSGDFDFSFSGLKTAVSNLLRNEGVLSPNAANSRRAKRAYPRRKPQDACVSEQVSGIADRNILPNLCASIEAAIVDVLVKKTVAAAQSRGVDQIIVAGGVAANQKLSETMAREAKLNSLSLFIPPPSLCTDNAAMIVAAAFYNPKPIGPLKLQANPNLSLAY